MKTHIKKFFLTIRASLVLVILFSTAVMAQVDTANVLGTIKDANGAVLAGVKVTLTNSANSQTQTTQTDEQGNYEFLAVKIGIYKLSAEQKGFTTAIADNIGVTVNARQRVDMALKVGEVTENIMVSGAAQLLEADSSERGQIINTTQIVSLPLNGRSYANLALLTPGVRESGFNSIVGSPGREASFNVNGLRSTFNNFIIDGVDNNYFGTSNQGFSNQVVQPSPDAVAEFKVETNTYSAEFGRSGGAVINASFRSGTNQFHGSAWEFLRNTSLNAVGFFKPAGGVKPTLIRNQFGGTFGGPIKSDKTFFFLDYEGFRDVGKRLQFATLPVLALRQGHIGAPVKNPFTGTVYADGNIPTSDIIPFAQKVLADLPLPNLSGTSNNFSGLTRTNTFSDKWNVKLDHTFNAQLNGFIRVSHRKYDQFVEPLIPGQSGGGDNGNVHVLNQQLAGGLTYTLSNNSVLDFRVSGTKGKGGKNPIFLGGPSMFDIYGLTGLPTDKSLTGGLTTQTISGFTDLGRQATNPQFQDPDSFNARVSYSWIHGRHSFKAGYENLILHTTVQDINPLYGHDTYNAQFSRGPGASASNNFNFADFLFGARNQYELGTFFLAHLRQQMNSGYIHDDFKAGPHLTLNLGLRYEYGTPYYEKDNHQSNYDPTTNTIIQAKDGSIADRALVNPDRKNFSPRFGFAYSFNNNTVIRGGYGIGYIHFNRVGSADLLATNFPQATRSLLNQDFSTPVCVGNNFAGCFRGTQQGYPTNMPDTVVLFIPRDTKNGYVQNWQVSIQRQLTKDTILDVAYVGNHSVKLTMLGDLNQAAPNPATGTAIPLQQRRPIPNFATISMAFDGGFANYNALQVKLERRFTRGLYILNSFTWSKALDNVAQSLENGNGDNPNPQNLHNLAADRGISSYDQPFNNTTSVVWEVPVGKNRSYFSDLNPVVDGFLGGWSITMINQMLSGQPINLIYTPTPDFSVTANLPNFIGGNAPRPNLIGDPNLPSDQQTIDKYFNTANVLLPTDRSNPFGNAARNVARANSFFQTDFGVQKSFRLPREGTRIEFRAEMFNTFNHTNFGPANGNRSSGGFGQIRSTFPARQVQMAFKLVF